ncbi:MAG TPA: tol-pal system-associated acyl-CoA thioesterase [Nevskiales bacterium]|nr:tol-pal system-associated acyl-CoA thioesterase [Nevskiales bacterium]
MKEFVWPLRVYYEDTDSGGVVYYANYLKFLERARTEWLRARGLQQDVLARELGVLFMVRSVELDYRRPARLDDWLEVRSRVAEVRPASLGFVQAVWRPGGPGELLCSGRVRVACVDAATLRPRSIPELVLTEIVSGQ